MTFAKRGDGSAPVFDISAYPVYQFDVEKTGFGRSQFWITSYVGNPYEKTTDIAVEIKARLFAAGFTINDVTLYQEGTDPSPI